MNIALKRVRPACLAAAVAVAAAVACGPAPGAGGDGAPTVTTVRASPHTAYTRLVVELSDAVAFDIFALDDPERLVIDLPALTFALTKTPFDAGAVGVVDGMRYGSFKPDVSRIVLDLNAPVRVKSAFLIPPEAGKATRFVLDLAVSDAAAFEAFVRTGRREPPPPPVAAAPPGGGAVVVVDPGHGGIDPGALGTTGVLEKDVALDAARELAERLAERGYRVVMTRDRDVYVGLRDRVAIARNAGADLFLSIHADSMANSRIRGSYVFSLSEQASDAEAAALAAKENKSDILAGVDPADYSPDVNTIRILLDLTQRETNKASVKFANMVMASFDRRGVHKIGSPLRKAGFAVLKAPDVPSLLVELGFLSNREDEKMLLTRAGREPIVAALADAVDDYFAAHATAAAD